VGVIDVTGPADVPQEVRQQQVLQLVESVRALPGVASAAAVQRLPLRDRGDNWGISIAEQPDLDLTTTVLRVVTRDYFSVMGIPVLQGRGFEASDRPGGELVIVIDEALAQKYFPGENPIGQHIESGSGMGWMRIVGVVESVLHDGLAEPAAPGRYVLYDQHDYTPQSTVLVLRAQPGANMAAVLQGAVRTIERGLPTAAVEDATTMASVVALAMGPTRRIMQLMTLLGGLALTLGAVGVYGVVSHFVNRRRRDWVIRMALGMQPASVLGQVVGRGALLVLVGCLLGLAAALAATRVLTSLLYDVSAADPLALLAAATTLLVTGCAAALLPAWRASRANAAAVLRDI
jgi:putative ABC transport system permease protein